MDALEMVTCHQDVEIEQLAKNAEDVITHSCI